MTVAASFDVVINCADRAAVVDLLSCCQGSVGWNLPRCQGVVLVCLHLLATLCEEGEKLACEMWLVKWLASSWSAECDSNGCAGRFGVFGWGSGMAGLLVLPCARGATSTTAQSEIGRLQGQHQQ